MSIRNARRLIEAISHGEHSGAKVIVLSCPDWDDLWLSIFGGFGDRVRGEISINGVLVIRAEVMDSYMLRDITGACPELVML